MTLCCRSGGCHENGRHEVPFDLMESLANSVANMLVGEHIVEQGLLLCGSLGRSLQKMRIRWQQSSKSSDE